MQPEEITDRDSLEAWLKTRSQEESVRIANRAAARVAPLWVDYTRTKAAERQEITSLIVLRPLIVSGVASAYPSPEIKIAAAATRRAYAAAYSTPAYSYATPVYGAVVAVYTTPAAAARAASAAYASYNYATAYAASHSPSVHAVFLRMVQTDCRLLSEGKPLEGASLWHDEPNPLDSQWQATRTEWQAPNSPYRFWLRWYEAALQGHHLNLELEHDIALIPSEDWEKGPDHIATLIDALEMKHALAATDNAERIELNPETGKLRLVPETELPDDIAAYARRKIARAVNLFGDQPENQYSALTPDLKMLRDAVEDAANLPVELFDACASASRRLGLRAKGGECPEPEKDPLLQDYLQRIREAGADILSHDPKTQQVLERRNAILGNNALIEERETVIAAVEQITPLTEGRLNTALATDAETATNPNAPDEERKVASFKLVSRVLGIWATVSKTVGAIARVPAFMAGIEILWRLPGVRWLVDLLLKYL
jgi:hypothetical protein